MTYKQVVIQNAIVAACTATLVLGLFYMSGSFHSLWGLILMLMGDEYKEGK